MGLGAVWKLFALWPYLAGRRGLSDIPVGPDVGQFASSLGARCEFAFTKGSKSAALRRPAVFPTAKYQLNDSQSNEETSLAFRHVGLKSPPLKQAISNIPPLTL
jgi:hypothetical protein